MNDKVGPYNLPNSAVIGEPQEETPEEPTEAVEPEPEPPE